MSNPRPVFTMFSQATVRRTLPILSLLFLAACSQAPDPQTPLADLQVGYGSAEASEDGESPAIPAENSEEASENGELPTTLPSDSAGASGEGELPAIVPGRSDFHATDPATVVLASVRVQFIEFFAYWCSVCKAMAPTVHGLENLYGEQVEFIYLDRDDPATLPLQEILGYIYQPPIFILDAEGNILYQRSGYVEAVELQ